MTGTRSHLAQSNASPERQLARLEAKIPTDRSGCWPWFGQTTAAGYGLMRTGPGTRDYVHRVAYRLFVGPIPDGMQIDHLCRVRACFNPAHLEAVPGRVNWLRGESLAAIAYRTNTCRNGHDMSVNAMVNQATGTRRCRACNYEWQRRRRAQRRSSPTPE